MIDMHLFQNFYYHSYDYYFDQNYLNIKYVFEIENLDTFETNYKIPYTDQRASKQLDDLIFHLGLIESLSVYKLTCAKNYYCQIRKLDNFEQDFFLKLMALGLGEFYYLNNLDFNQLKPNIICPNNLKQNIDLVNYQLKGTLIPVGGGKDSIVSIEALKNQKDVKLFLINDLISACQTVEVSSLEKISIHRTFDTKIVQYNKQGFYNGHTPFSAVLAFSASICALTNGYLNIALSNESSANESSILNSKVNHQYSKTYEFESDFRNLLKYLNIEINYFSFLRPLSEIHITKLFSRLTKYHTIFSSCNRYSKQGQWCLNCPKCLFVFIMLSVYLSKEELLSIFKANLYDNISQLENFRMLCGLEKTKPFECVGTIKEVLYALNRASSKFSDSYLIKYFKESNIEFENNESELFVYNQENFLTLEFENILKEFINVY